MEYWKKKITTSKLECIDNNEVQIFTVKLRHNCTFEANLQRNQIVLKAYKQQRKQLTKSKRKCA